MENWFNGFWWGFEWCLMVNFEKGMWKLTLDLENFGPW